MDRGKCIFSEPFRPGRLILYNHCLVNSVSKTFARGCHYRCFDLRVRCVVVNATDKITKIADTLILYTKVPLLIALWVDASWIYRYDCNWKTTVVYDVLLV